MIKKAKKRRDYESEILDAQFEIAKLMWEEAGRTREPKKELEKGCTV